MTRAACLLVGSLAIAASAGAAPATVPTFTKDVAPIVFNHCAACHRAGEVAPMTLITYEDVRPWAKSIRAKVASRQRLRGIPGTRCTRHKHGSLLTAESCNPSSRIGGLVTW